MADNFQILLTPVVGLMSLAFLFSTLLRKFHGARYESLAFGSLFGLVMVVGMINPIQLGEGIIVDTRTLLLGAAVVFGGPVAGAVALAFGVTYRIYLGGSGMVPGVVGLFLAYALAWVCWRYLRKIIKSPVLFDAVTGVVITVSFGAVFLFPADVAWGIIQSVLPTLLVCNVIGVVAIGLVFRREIDYFLAAKALEQFARRDPLTDLLNRRGLDAEMSNVRFDSARGHALFYFDVDNFKTINDSFGHEAGDTALAVVAARLKNSLRKEAIFARHGGDEFSIYLPSIKASDVEGIAERLCRLVADESVVCADMSFDLSISVGGYWSRVPCALQEMINQADAQLLIAKSKGKNRAQVAYNAEGLNAAAA